ncbi:urease accessory protein UreF [Candidatus Blochmannia ocreatus (nom. nud.)]|uniref:Urease accessory protein UreF n=1 Tax=Candidatus Blochmannia ocreatus (nom. nud.) TaxID=251538 RepID=A0ABY4SSQ1_9ENTR|nr:urease accessory UreF family protein [Candidatus Blochmannia ocreatus]URJ25004.1 urease accessory protein UreF [Candidatus Blochmannia ocreatus]
MCIKQNSVSLLFLMQLISSNLPVGGFMYSRGLEWAIEYKLVNSEKTFCSWQEQWINGTLVYLDWPMLKRCYYYTKISDEKNFFQCTSHILSYRDTYELRLEEQQRGKAMKKLVLQWYPTLFTNQRNNTIWLLALERSGLASIAWLGCMCGIPLHNLALGYAYNMLEASVMVGLKLVLFGQSSAQSLLRYFITILPKAWEKSKTISDSELGSSFLLQSIASACHETQYCRLFRS